MDFQTVRTWSLKNPWPDYAVLVLGTEGSLSLLDLREQEGGEKK